MRWFLTKLCLIFRFIDLGLTTSKNNPSKTGPEKETSSPEDQALKRPISVVVTPIKVDEDAPLRRKRLKKRETVEEMIYDQIKSEESCQKDVIGRSPSLVLTRLPLTVTTTIKLKKENPFDLSYFQVDENGFLVEGTTAVDERSVR